MHLLYTEHFNLDAASRLTFDIIISFCWQHQKAVKSAENAAAQDN